MSIDGRWLMNFRETELWETPDSHSWLMKLTQFTTLRQEEDQVGGPVRLHGQPLMDPFDVNARCVGGQDVVIPAAISH